MGSFAVLELGFLALSVSMGREEAFYSEFLYIGNGSFFLSLLVLVLLHVVFSCVGVYVGSCLYGLRLFCLVAHVACPLLWSCIVCHVMMDACRIFLWNSRVCNTSSFFLALAARQFSSWSMFFVASIGQV